MTQQDSIGNQTVLKTDYFTMSSYFILVINQKQPFFRLAMIERRCAGVESVFWQDLMAILMTDSMFYPEFNLL